MKSKIIITLFFFSLGIFLLFSFSYSEKKGIQDVPSVIQLSNLENELFYDYYDEAEVLMNDMTIENKISQIFLVNYGSPLYGNDPSYIGGYMFYKSFFAVNNKESVLSFVNNLQEKSKIKSAIVVDEEGGTVSRIGIYEQYREKMFPSPRNLYEQGGLELILKTENEKDELLLELGINLNLAPVADIATNPKDFMYDRSLGQDVETTSNYISELTKVANSNGLSTCLKHFPGYGSNGDTHDKVIEDERTLEYLKENDFKPFEAGINAGSPFIMMSHNKILSLDSDYPASLSKKVIDILKNDLNFSGVILTDDIAMSALYEYNAKTQAAILALNAGADMIMTSNYANHYNELIKAYKNGEISEERINYSVRKIIAWKIAYNII